MFAFHFSFAILHSPFPLLQFLFCLWFVVLLLLLLNIHFDVALGFVAASSQLITPKVASLPAINMAARSK